MHSINANIGKVTVHQAEFALLQQRKMPDIAYNQMTSLTLQAKNLQ